MWMYFKTADEAHDWLEFDGDPEEQEQRSYSDPDRFEEWLHWRDAWEAAV